MALVATVYATTAKPVRRAPRTAASAATSVAARTKAFTPARPIAAILRAYVVTASAPRMKAMQLVRGIVPIYRTAATASAIQMKPTKPVPRIAPIRSIAATATAQSAKPHCLARRTARIAAMVFAPDRRRYSAVSPIVCQRSSTAATTSAICWIHSCVRKTAWWGSAVARAPEASSTCLPTTPECARLRRLKVEARANKSAEGPPNRVIGQCGCDGHLNLPCAAACCAYSQGLAMSLQLLGSAPNPVIGENWASSWVVALRGSCFCETERTIIAGSSDRLPWLR